MEWIYKEGRIYSENEKGELMAEATYVTMPNGEISIDHTYVNPSLRGQGVANKMMVAVAEYLRQCDTKAVASCSYAISWFKKNEEAYSDIIFSDFDNQDAGCKIDGKH
ncbi:MAG: N-acetyltransferase [Peptostreptococcaceae bacterium]|nr:N-acetyltransferase [Peptostreptococcaceae bacterium]